MFNNINSANSVEQFDQAKIKEVFEVERCTAWIKRNGLSKTTLQFPDSLLKYAPTVALQIEREIGGHRYNL